MSANIPFMAAWFSADDVVALARCVGEAWSNATDRDWHVPAGTLSWDCYETADHAINAVIAPAFILASRRTDRYPDLGSGFHVDPDTTPTQFIERLLAAAEVLRSVITASEPDASAVIFPPAVVAPAAEFAPRAGLELILHTHDVCRGLDVPFEPPADLCARLRDHTSSWRIWSAYTWKPPTVSDDPWADLLTASDRSR